MKWCIFGTKCWIRARRGYRGWSKLISLRDSRRGTSRLRGLEASRSRGFEDCEVSELRGLSIYDHLSRPPSMRIRTYLLHGEPEGRKPKPAILNPRPICYCIHWTSFYAKQGSPWVSLDSLIAYEGDFCSFWGHFGVTLGSLWGHFGLVGAEK